MALPSLDLVAAKKDYLLDQISLAVKEASITHCLWPLSLCNVLSSFSASKGAVQFWHTACTAHCQQPLWATETLWASRPCSSTRVSEMKRYIPAHSVDLSGEIHFKSAWSRVCSCVWVGRCDSCRLQWMVGVQRTRACRCDVFDIRLRCEHLHCWRYSVAQYRWIYSSDGLSKANYGCPVYNLYFIFIYRASIVGAIHWCRCFSWK